MKEEWIAIAILRLLELEKCVVEGAGASGLAAVLAGQLDELKGKRYKQINTYTPQHTYIIYFQSRFYS